MKSWIKSTAEFARSFTPSVYLDRRISLVKVRLVTMTGHPGHGKTTVAMEMAVQYGHGYIFDRHLMVRKRRVLYFGGENSHDNRVLLTLICLQEGVD